MKQRRLKVSAIVPVFNEETTVALVVEVLLRCGHVDEVICVNDGSTDSSSEVLRWFGDRIAVIDLQPNRGKGHALADGIRRASGDVVVFVDADLVGLTAEHVAALLEPIGAGRARAVLGRPGGDFFYSVAGALAPRIADSIGSTFSGQRAYLRQDLVVHAARMEATRFGVEVYLNGLFPKKETAVVALHGLASLWKHEKHGWPVAVREYCAQVREIARAGWARLAE